MNKTTALGNYAWHNNNGASAPCTLPPREAHRAQASPAPLERLAIMTEEQCALLKRNGAVMTAQVTDEHRREALRRLCRLHELLAMAYADARSLIGGIMVSKLLTQEAADVLSAIRDDASDYSASMVLGLLGVALNRDELPKLQSSAGAQAAPSNNPVATEAMTGNSATIGGVGCVEATHASAGRGDAETGELPPPTEARP